MAFLSNLSPGARVHRSRRVASAKTSRPSSELRIVLPCCRLMRHWGAVILPDNLHPVTRQVKAGIVCTSNDLWAVWRLGGGRRGQLHDTFEASLITYLPYMRTPPPKLRLFDCVSCSLVHFDKAARGVVLLSNLPLGVRAQCKRHEDVRWSVNCRLESSDVWQFTPAICTRQ